MKNLCTAMLLCLLLPACKKDDACEKDDEDDKNIVGSGNIVKETRVLLRGFTGVNVSSGITLNYTQAGAAPKVEVRADDNILSDIETRVENGILNVSLKLKGRAYEQILTEVNVSGLLLTSADFPDFSIANLSFEDNDENSRLSLTAFRSSAITATSGSVGNVDLYMRGTSRFLGFPLEVANYSVNMSDASRAEIHCTDKISGSLTVASELKYRGGATTNANELLIIGASTVTKTD